MTQKKGDTFSKLTLVMDELREKCPWDKKQTIESLRHLTIEEMYELADAIIDGDWKGIQEELGDLLLHIVFYAKIAEEKNKFNIDDVINTVCEKLIARHPHIYGDVQVSGVEEVKQNWEKLKLKEGKKSVLGGVPTSLPATVKAMRLQEKARQVGFEWDEESQVWEKVQEEMEELQEAIRIANESKEKENAKENVEDEFGDVVFSLINYARFLQIDPENALERTNKKFIYRFKELEAVALNQGRDLQSMSLKEMDEIWNNIKKQQRE